jgi:putative transcriptional regulator
MISNKLSEIMGRRRIKVHDVARLTGLHRDTISSLYYDKSKGIDFLTLDLLCKALDVQPGELFTYQNDEE